MKDAVQRCLLLLTVLLLLVVLSIIVRAQNDPGHDSLYVLKLGDNVTGNINITGNLTATLVEATSRFFGPNIDLRGDGTSTANPNQIIGTPTNLEVSSSGNLILNKAVTGGQVYVGWPGTTTALNVTGNIIGAGTLNISGNAFANGAPVCTSTNGLCAPAGASSSAGGWTNTTTQVYLSNNNTNLSAGALLFVDNTNGRVGIKTATPTQALEVNGDVNVTGSRLIFPSNISIGTGAATGPNAIALGQNARAPANQSIAIGTGALTGSDASTTNASIAIGTSTYVEGIGSISIGYSATSLVGRGVAIGYRSTVDGSAGGAVALGDEAYVQSPGGIALGRNSSVYKPGGVAIGNGSSVDGAGGIAIGWRATAADANSTAIGRHAYTEYDATDALALGTNASVAGNRSIALGSFAAARGNDSIVIGIGNSTSAFTNPAPNTLAIGKVPRTAMVINLSVGSVGIGKTPAAPLDVYSADLETNGSPAMILQSNNSYPTIQRLVARDAGTVEASWLEFYKLGALQWRIGNDKQLDGGQNFFLYDGPADAYRLVVNGSGSVGIGTTAPLRRLHINDTLRMEPRSTAPATSALGDLYVDSDTNELCFSNGTAWVGLQGRSCA